MTLSLYDATVPSFIQVTNSCLGLVEKAKTWCDETSTPEAELVQSRIIDDMYPLAYQIKSVYSHSVGALEGIKVGVFSPNLEEAPNSLAEFKDKLLSTIDYLTTVDKEQLDARVGDPMKFEFKEISIPFKVETFLFSFSQPNFYFHATTAYDLLRAKGVPIGKLDFLGAMQIAK